MLDARLAVLVVHDTFFQFGNEDEILGTDDLALCRIGTDTYISEWQTVLEVLAHEKNISPPPDLLLVDARFEKDRSAPDLGPLSIKTLDGDSADPRGLLYGAVLAGLFNQLGNPAFGFEIYSADLPSIAKDPYARTFYGLLKGLAKDNLLRDKGTTFASQMGSGQTRPNPRQAWAPALQQYRRLLWKNAGTNWHPIYSSFAAAGEAVHRFTNNEQESLDDDLTVRWRRTDGTLRTVLLRSLYADVRGQLGNWKREAISQANVMGQLQELARKGKFLDDVTAAVIEGITYTEPESMWNDVKINRAALSPNEDMAKWCRAVSFLVLRALNLIDHKADPSIGVKNARELTYLVPSGELAENSIDNTLGRALVYVLTNERENRLRPGETIEALGESDTWPVNWSLDAQAVVIDVLAKLREKKEDRKRWPEWATVEDAL